MFWSEPQKEKQQEKVYECWVGRIVGVKRADQRRLDELRVEVGVKESFTKKLMRIRLQCAGHMERMGNKNIGKES